MKTLRIPAALALGLLWAACNASTPAAPTATGAPAGAPSGAPSGAPAAGGSAPQAGGGGNWQGGGQGAAGGQRRSAVITVQADTARVGDLTVDNTAAGAVAADTQSSVAAGASGLVKAVLRNAGDWVEAGTPIIQLDDSQLKLSVRLAQANLDQVKLNLGVSDSADPSGSKLNLQLQSAQSSLASAQKNWASAQALKKIGGISGSDYDNAQVQLQTAQANLEAAKSSLQTSGLQVDTATIQLQQAQLNLAYATLKAPYAGQISVVNVHPGEYVTASTAAYGLVSKKKTVTFSVAPTDAPGLTVGKDLKFTYAGRVYPTKITVASGAPVNGLVSFNAALPAGLEAALGTVGTVSYQVVLAHGALIPLPALQSAENKTFVYTINNGKAGRSEVQILAESGSAAAVTGLADNTQIVVNPPPGLLIGATVQAVGTTPAGGQGAAGQGQGQGQGGWNGQKRNQNGQNGQAPAATGDASTTPAAPGAGQGQGGWNGQRRNQNGQNGQNGQAATGQAPAATGGGN